MSPLPGNLDSLSDGTALTRSEVFGEESHNLPMNETKQHVVDSFYELAQLRPSIVDDLVSWKFLYGDYETAKDDDCGDGYWLDLISANETYEEWFRRLMIPALILPVPNFKGLTGALVEYPVSSEVNGRVYTEFLTDNEHDSILLVRDDNGVLRIFQYDSYE